MCEFFSLDLTELFIVLQVLCNLLYFFVRRCWTFLERASLEFIQIEIELNNAT